jgi:hypothetical protein
MGSHFSSAHLCTADEPAARAALATVCQGHGLRVWVSPLIGRWLSFFPKDSGGAVVASRELSDRCESVVLLTTLHDDAVFSYQLFRRGALVDEFVSHPDHFGTLNQHERQRVAGDPMQLTGYLDWPEAMFKLVHLLQSGGTTEAAVMMRSFFQVVGIVNGLSSYTYLEAGEHHTVALWPKFTHMPDLVAEQRARLARRRRIRHDKQHMRADGSLLFDSDLAHAAMPFRWFSVHCVDATTGGFICSGFKGSRSLQVWSPPDLPRDLPGPMGAFVRYGEWRALAHGRALATHIVGGTMIVDRATGAALPQYATADVHLVAADEPTDCGFFLKRSVLEARSLRDGAPRFSVPTQTGTRRFMVHPREPHVIWFSQRFLGIFEKHTGRHITELELFNPLILPKKAAQWRERDVDPGAIPEMSREDFLALDLSSDGEWLFAGTSEGLRVYRYADIVAARIQMPTPVGGVETSTRLQDHQWVHALAVDSPRTTVLFSTGGDTVHSFNWRTGATRQLTPSFEHKTICQMWLSPQTRALVCWLRGPLDVPKRRDCFSFATWNLDALIAHAIEA